MLNGTTFNETALARLQLWMFFLTRHIGRTLPEGALLDIIRYRPDAHDRHCTLLGFSIGAELLGSSIVFNGEALQSVHAGSASKGQSVQSVHDRFSNTTSSNVLRAWALSHGDG